MSRILLSATIIGTTVLVASPAYAAEVSCGCVAALPLPPSPVSGGPLAVAPWAGPYVGINIAFIDNNIHQSENGPGQWPAAYGAQYHDNYSFSSGRIGIHAGYAMQRGSAVFGVETDIGKSLGSETHVGLFTGNDSFRPQWDASARLRAGVVTGDTLLYGTGGVSLARVNLKLDDVPAGSNTHVGWTAGVGAEVLLSDKITGRLETRYTDYGDKNYQTLHGPISMGFDEKRLSVGLSYKF